MPTYEPITEVVPLASMVTGLAMPSALGNQMRDDLVALYKGVWFRATGTAVTLSASAVLLPMSVLTMSETATDSGSVTLSSGTIRTLLPGHWWVGGQFACSTSAQLEIFVDATDAAASFVAENGSDTASAKTEIAASTIVEVTTIPNTFALYGFSSGSPVAVANTYSPLMWGVWLGELA